MNKATEHNSNISNNLSTMSKKPTYEELEKRIVELEHAESQRKQAEHALRESELNLRQITETIEDVFWMSTPGVTKITYVSPAYEKIWKRSTHELYESPRSFIEAIHPDDTKHYLSIIDSYHARGEAYQCEYRILPEPQSTLWIREQGFPIQDENGATVLMTGVCADITARKKMEIALKKSNARFKEIFNQHFQFMAILTPEGRVVNVNELVLRSQGFKREDYIGRLFWESPAWRGLPEWQTKIRDRIFKAKWLHAPIITEDIYTMADGTIRYADASCTAIRDQSGEVLYIVMQASDITARKHMENALRDSTSRLSSFLNNSPVAMGMWDRNFRYVFVNEALRKMNGPSLEEHIGHTIEEVLPKSAHIIRPLFEEILTTGQTFENLELKGEVPSRPGQISHYLASYFPILASDDKVKFIGASITDISNLKRAEEALCESERKYRRLIDLAQEGIWEIDKDNHTTFVNPSMAKMLGYTPEEMLGKPVFAFMDKNGIKFAQENLKRRQQGISEQHDFVFFRKDGGRVNTTIETAPIIDENGFYQGAIAGVIDITERMRSEEKLRKSIERYRAVAEDTPVLLCRFQRDGEITYVNKAYCTYFEKTPDELVGSSFLSLIPDKDRKTTMANILALTVESPTLSHEHRVIAADGSIRWHRWTNRALFDSQGQPTGYQSIGEDITETMKLQTQLNQAQKMEAIGNLAGGIAHDFNNILSSIIGFTELALDDVSKDSMVEDHLHEVFIAGKRAKDLVKQILAFARQSEEKVKPIQVDKIIEETLQFIRSSVPTTIEIGKDIDSDSLIMGNETQVHQIIMNLCTNAAHAMEERGGVLNVSLKDIKVDRKLNKTSDLKYGSYIKIAVSDTGVGIPSHIIDSVFEPYYTTKEPGEGTGMGLAMVLGIVESYGGRIAVDSQPGKGTTFVIHLPIIGERKAIPAYTPEELPTGTERILLVDDELPIARMGSQILERSGYSVTSQTSSIEALKLFQTKPDGFDLVISDMTMPNMTGDQLAIELMKIRPDIPIILFTGYSKQISNETASDIGIKAFAYKPVVKADLIKTVRKVLDEVKN